MKEINIKAADNKDIYTYIWDDVINPEGVIQLVHGSCEHSLRYENFAKYLNKNNWIVISSDHRGHGKTANVKNNELGFFAENNGWKILISDLKIINDYIKENYNNLKIVMIGHSMGSFLARTYAIDYSQTIEKLILSGTGWEKKSALKFGRWLATKRQKKYGAKNIDYFIWKFSYKPFNKKFKNKNSNGCEWLSIDPDNVEKFINDPLCGQVFTSSAFKDMFDGLLYNQSKKNISKIRKDLPIFLISGHNDPVGKYGKAVKKTFKVFKKNKLNVSMKLYPNLRHEILLDIDKGIIYTDIMDFLSNN